VTEEVRGYVLAGGRSSRMGMDKAELRLGGRTLLEIAVGKLAGICREVVVVGGRERVPAGVRVIEDLRPGCGPVGGMAAALQDAGTGRAMFLPVDMPLIPGELLRRVAAEWIGSGGRVAFAVSDGIAQPLVSLVGAEFGGEFEEAVERGEYRVRVLLEECGAAAGGVRRAEIDTGIGRESVWPGWMPDEEAWRTRALWFANLNTPEEFAEAERLAGRGLAYRGGIG
jgi:molybdopterin-guanine dinucleotide biosynthesis protein A